MVRSSLKPPRLPAALIVASAAIFTFAPGRAVAFDYYTGQQSTDPKTTKHNSRPSESSPGETTANEPRLATLQTTYSYEFSQPEFYIRHITIEHDENGAGKITFQRKNEETPFVEPLEISPTAWARLRSHWQALQFLDSQTEYQSSKQFPHLGTVSLGMIQGTRQRKVEFNWSNNTSASALVNEYRKVADQAIVVFDISVARENQPLNTPKLMEHLDGLLRRNWLSDPQQLIPLLKEITNDEHLPLIARNHATRILKKLEK